MRAKTVFLFAMMAACTTPVSALAQESPNEYNNEFRQDAYDEWDTNQDWSISFDEYYDYAIYELGQNAAQAAFDFEELDRDDDGELTYEEFDSATTYA